MMSPLNPLIDTGLQSGGKHVQNAMNRFNGLSPLDMSLSRLTTFLLLVACLAVSLSCLGADAPTSWSLASPDHQCDITVSLDGGALT